jgi:hypothetical protein
VRFEGYFFLARILSMASSLMIFFLIINSLFIYPCFSIDTTLVQVDLVFPRNNSIYRPVYPFPIVFALLNFGKTWQYKPVLNWRLVQWQPQLGTWAVGESGSMGWSEERTDPKWPPPGDSVLAINSSQAVVADNSSWWSLEYEFRFGPRPNDCSGPGFQPQSGGSQTSNAWFYTGSMFFNISNSTGAMPDMKSGGSCSVGLGAVGFTGQNDTDPRCPALSWLRPNPSSCAFSIDNNVTDQVSRAMVNASQCKGGTWPMLSTKCSTATSDGRRFDWSIIAALLPLFAVVLGLS